MTEASESTSATGTTAAKQWYIIHTQTGQELKVKASLEGKIQQGLAAGRISRVLVPTE